MWLNMGVVYCIDVYVIYAYVYIYSTEVNHFESLFPNNSFINKIFKKCCWGNCERNMLY